MRPERDLRRSGIAGLIWLAASTAQAASMPLAVPPAAAPQKTSELAAARDSATRLTISVMVNGHGPYPFVVDTGADRTVISRELAATLKLPAGPIASLHDTAGEQQVETAIIDSLAFGGRELHGIAAPILGAAGLGADGMLGTDSLHNQHVVMDFRADKFVTSVSRWSGERDANAIAVPGRRRLGQLILVDADSQGEPIYVILDSGAENTVGNAALLRRVLAARAGQPPLKATEVISVTGRTTPASVDDLPELHLGGITIRHVPIAFADLHTFAHFGLIKAPAMLIGMDVLRHFRSVTVDFRRGEALFVTE